MSRSTIRGITRAKTANVEQHASVNEAIQDDFVGVVHATDVIDALDEETTKQMVKQAGLWFR